MKTISMRIQYYTRKVAQKSSVSLAKATPQSHRYRHERLLSYKVGMHKLIEAERKRWGDEGD